METTALSSSEKLVDAVRVLDCPMRGRTIAASVCVDCEWHGGIKEIKQLTWNKEGTACVPKVKGHSVKCNFPRQIKIRFVQMEG